ncbi:MAG TPA: FecR domain-containing protein [Candidatus Dormibacteraeota bacterium]|nr:FecR domain-containing protein [Candidatus Dormibacteraeota bacterium]
MTHWRFLPISLTVAAVMVLAVAQTTPPQQTVLPVGSATVTEVKGEATLTAPDGTPVKAERGATLAAESKIETLKGSVLLELQDGSQVLVKGHSNVVLRSPDQGKGFSLELFLGQIIVKVKKRMGETPSFRMGTPSAVITVRGTRFLVDVNKKRRTYVDVFEGIVEVQGMLPGSRQVLIRPGFSSGVEQDRSPSEPREDSPGEGMDREDSGRAGQTSGGERNSGDQQKSQPKQGSEGKPD